MDENPKNITEATIHTPKKQILKKCRAILWKGETCRCKEIKIIQKCMRKYYTKLSNLHPISYNTDKTDKITYKSINVFIDKNRTKNDYNNKKRENIIGAILNNKILNEYYKYSPRWNLLKNTLDGYIKELCEHNDIHYIEKINCIHKAGRGNNYDFKLIINDNEEFMIEFKFNASCVEQTPQFVSPMRPSQYLESSYEEYYYDNYLSQVTTPFNLPFPEKEEYLKSIHSPKPKCLKEHQDKYYRGCKQSSRFSGEKNDIDFYETSKTVSQNSISTFISTFGIDKDKLTEYLLKTQKNKYYMLYKNGKIYLELINLNNYIITEIIKDPAKYRYLAKTKSDKQLKILLRWKNGNGIAFPSFQIS